MKTRIPALLLAAAAAAFAAPLRADSVRFDSKAAPSTQFSRTVSRPGVPDLPPSAGLSPLAVSIVPPAQFPAEDWDVCGLRLNLFVGRHRDVSFVDVGVLGNVADGNLSGLEFAGIYNRVGESDGAIQVAGIYNGVRGDFAGLQISVAANDVGGDMEGVQISLVNLAEDGAGLQIGLFNRAERFSGLQLGLANYAYQLEGIQIGLFNVIEDSNVPFMPIVNVAF